MRRSAPRPGRSATAIFTTLAVIALMLSAIALPKSTARAAEAQGSATEAFAQAAETGEAVPIDSKTTKDTQLLANPDGTITAELSSGPVREPDPESPSGWTPIDLTLQAIEGGIAPAVADADITFSAGGSSPIATLASEGRSYGVSWPSTLPPPSLAGSTATYTDVLDGIDLQLQARVSGYGMTLVVPAPPTSPIVLDLPLSLVGLTASVDEQEQLVLSDASLEVGRAAPAEMWSTPAEAGGEPTVVAPVGISIIDELGGQSLRIAPDMAFFARQDVTYPVVIDPSPSLSVHTDTYVRQTQGSSSYGTDTNLKIGIGSDNGIARSYIKFEVGDLAHTHIFTAKVRLYQTDANSCTPTTMNVYGLTSGFTNSTTWNTKPSTGSLYASVDAAQGHAGCSSNWVEAETDGDAELTLVDLVQSWANGAQNYGLELRADDEVTNAGWKRFNSSDAGSNAPTLEVSYNPQLTDTSDNEDGTSWWNTDDADGNWPQTTTSFDPYGLQHPSHPAYDKITYKSFGSSPTVHMHVYEFTPTDPGTYPALVLVHGGGFRSGSPTDISDIADELATGVQYWRDDNLDAQSAALGKQFIVFDIEYRLSCNVGDDYVPGTPIAELCGWQIDDLEDGVPVAINDIKDSVGWVRDNYNAESGWSTPYGVDWDTNNVVLVGASSGGNQSAMVPFYATGSSVPEAIATWSGAQELDEMSDTHYGCEDGYSRDSEHCWSATNQYLNCDGTPDLVCVANGVYSGGSPIDHYDFSSGPPDFFANGGGGVHGPELIALKEAQDFYGRYGTAAHTLCVVDKPKHATAYLGSSCEDDSGETVLQATVAFLALHLV